MKKQSFINRIKRSICAVLAVSMISAAIFEGGAVTCYTGSNHASAAKKATLKLSKTKVTLSKGKTAKVKITANGKVTVASDNKKIATASISKKYVVIKAKKNGTTNIRVTCTYNPYKIKNYLATKYNKKKNNSKTLKIKVTVGKGESSKVKSTATPKADATVDPEVIENAARDMKPYTGAIKTFGNKTLKAMHSDNDNTFISPLSIYMAFAMLANGASGNTYNEIVNTLGITDFAGFNNVIGNYISGSLDPEVTFKVADSVWLGKKLQQAAGINENFVNPLQTYYKSEVRKDVDFASQETVDAANKWVEDKTGGMIKNLFQGFDPEMVAMLINALYFEGRWSNVFKAENTVDEPFYGVNGPNTVKMMTNQYVTKSSYFENDKFKGLRMSYGRHYYVMDILMSADENVNTTTLWNSLTDEERDNILGNADYSDVTVKTLKLPKFSIDYSDNGKLMTALRGMGMNEVFTANANLSKIGNNAFVNEVKHKAVLEVTEEGSKAAAVTYIALATSAYRPEKPKEVDFIVNRPFVFAIRDNWSGAVLFLGEVNKL